MRVIAKRLRREDGQAVVELAFVLPILLLFLFGIIDFGLALNNANSNTNAANLAAREASVIGTATSASCTPPGSGTATTFTTIQAWTACEVTGDGSPVPTICVADVAGSTPSSTYSVGDPIKVEASTTFHWASILTGNSGTFLGKVVSPSTTLTSSASLRLEDSVNGTQTTGTSSFLNSTANPPCTS